LLHTARTNCCPNGFSTSSLLTIDRKLWTLILLWMLAHLFQCDLDCAFKLWIAPCSPVNRQDLNLYIRRNTEILPAPDALSVVVVSPIWDSQCAAVEQIPIPPTDFGAQSSLPHNLPQPGRAEHKRH